MIPLLVRIAIILVGSWAMGILMGRWLERPDINPTHVKHSCLVAIVLVFMATFMYAHGRTTDSPLLINYGWWINQAISRVIIGSLVVLIIVCVIRVIKYLKHIHDVPSQLITPAVLFLLTKGRIIGDETKETLVLSRDQLENELREISGVPDLAFRWVEGCQLPFTVGFSRPMICCPLWISQVGDASYLQILLRHEAEHVALGHHKITYIAGVLQAAMPWLRGTVDALLRAMELEVDRRIVAISSDQGLHYKEALRVVVQKARGTVLAGIGHDPRHIDARVHQMTGAGSNDRWPMAGVVSLGILMVGCSAVAGRPALGDMLQISLRQQGTDIRIMDGDPQAHILGIPGAGGILPSGIGIDVRSIQGSHVLVESLPRTPLTFKGETEILMDYRVKGAGPVKPMVTVSIGREPVRTQIPGTNAWMELDTHEDVDMVDLQQGKGVAILRIQGVEGALYEVSGPRVGVAKGWMVELTSFRLREPKRRDESQQRDHSHNVQIQWKAWKDAAGWKESKLPNLSWAPERGLVGF